MFTPEQFKHLSTYLIANEAISRGIDVKKMVSEGPLANQSLLELNFNGHTEYVAGQRTSKTDVIAFWLQKNKYNAKLFFKRAGLSVAAGEVFSASDTKAIGEYAEKINYPVVVKKINGTHGDDVYVNISNKTELEAAVAKFSDNVFIEEMFDGIEFRIFATREKFVAATRRVPANVIGDGVKTIEELVEEKNSDPRRSDGYTTGLKTIKLDSVVEAFLKKEGMDRKSIPAKGRQIFLRENSNLSTGGDSIDVTDLVHDDIKKIAVDAVRSIPGLAYAGVDFLTKTDISIAPSKDSYIIIEVNDSPMISMHHYPYEGIPRDAAGAIVDLMFPETK